MFILTDGENYIMENPVKQGVYISTSCLSMAKKIYLQTGKNSIK